MVISSHSQRMPNAVAPLTAEQVKEAILAAERTTAGREVFFEISIDKPTLWNCHDAGMVKIGGPGYGIAVWGYKVERLLDVPGLALTVYHSDTSWIGEDRHPAESPV